MVATSNERADLSGKTVVVLGVGIQGRAVVEDLETRSDVGHLIAVDCREEEALKPVRASGARRTAVRAMDVADERALRLLLADADLVINMLPARFEEPVLRVAIDAGVHLVSTNYAHHLRRYDEAAARRGIVAMPEAGFDPGIDLVLARHAVDELDDVHTLRSYGAGIPAPECRNVNAINYKISWSFEGVLRAYARPARVIRDGEVCEVPGQRIFDPEWTHSVEVDEVGELEAFVNGDALEFLQMLGIERTVRTSGRYSLRWPGHCAFWRRFSQMGFLDERPDPSTGLSPRDFVARHLEPRLHYAPGERDMILLRVDVGGTRRGQEVTVRWEMADCGDPASGTLAMSRAVGYAASVVAQMILGGTIARRGVGSPARDVPPAPFLQALAERGVAVRRTILTA